MQRVHAAKSTGGGRRRERDAATTWRMLLEVFGTVVGVVMQSAILSGVGGGGDIGCGTNQDEPPDPDDPDPDPLPSSNLKNMQLAHLYAAFAANVLIVVCSLVTAFGVPERPQVRVRM